MSLFIPKTESDLYLAEVGMTLLECDICGVRFSRSMEWAWPFCSAGIPHEKLDSQEQIRRQKLLAETPEKATASFTSEVIKLYEPSRLKANWEDAQLPDKIDVPIVSLPKERMKEFANNYRVAGEFIGNILGKHKWCMLDLIAYSRKAWPIRDTETPPNR